MGKSFAKGDFVKGLVDAIIKSGEELKRYFPYTEGDINEQPDDISFGE